MALTNNSYNFTLLGTAGFALWGFGAYKLRQKIEKDKETKED
jgi:hypothetical protein